MGRTTILKALSLLVAMSWAFGLMGQPAAMAVDRGEIVITDNDRQLVKNYPRLTLTNTPASLCAQNNPNNCAGPNQFVCDLIELRFEISGGHDPFLIEMTLDWTPLAPASNSLNLYAWQPDQRDGVNCPQRVSGAPKPKQMFFVEPEGTFLITVINASGQNNGYSLSFRWIDIPLPDLEFRRTSGASESGAVFIPPRTASTPTTPSSGRNVSTSDSPGPTRTVLVPGPDGELQELEIPVLARGDREPAATSRVDPVVASVVGFLLLSGAVLTFLAVRRRQSEL